MQLFALDSQARCTPPPRFHPCAACWCVQVFASASASEPLPEGQVEMAKAAVSNLVGSMGYFYGSSQVMGEKGIARAREFKVLHAACLPTRSIATG